MLTDDKVRTLWKSFHPPTWAKWQKDYLDFLTWARDTPEAELRTEAAQRKLWNARVITPAGYGDAVNVGVLLSDPEFVDIIVGLRARSWPTDLTARASAIQAEYDRLVEMALERGVKPRPYAKLSRLLGALVPAELTCALSYDARWHAAELLLGNAGDHGIAGQVRIRARLRAVLGKEKDLFEHVRRSTFCWWLHENYDKFIASEFPPEIDLGAGVDTGVDGGGNTGGAVLRASPPVEALSTLGAPLRASLARIVEALEITGIHDPVADLEQVAELLYLKLLDEREPKTESRLFPGQAARYRWSNFRQKRGDDLCRFLADDVLPYMSSLVREDPIIAEYYQGATLRRTDPVVVERLVGEIDGIDFERLRPDETGQILEYLLSRVARGGHAAEFRTPVHLRALMVTLVDPQPGERIYDPACGTGGFLADAAVHVLAGRSTTPREVPIYGEEWLAAAHLSLDEAKRRYPELQTRLREGGTLRMERSSLGPCISGHDRLQQMIRIARMNLVLQQIGAANVRLANTIAHAGGPSPDDLARRHDVVISAPPFGEFRDVDNVRTDLPIPSTRREVLFVEVAMRALSPGGRCAIVVPEGLLFGEGKAQVALRRLLFDAYDVLAVIALGPGMLVPGSTIKASILVFRCASGGRKAPGVWFCEIRRDGYDTDARRSDALRREDPEANDIPAILRAWADYKRGGFTSPPGVETTGELDPNSAEMRGWWASKEQVQANGYDLSADRYRPRRPPVPATVDLREQIERTSDVYRVADECFQRLRRAVEESAALSRERRDRVRRVPLVDVVDVFSGSTPKRDDSWGSAIPWISPKDMKSDVIVRARDHVTERAIEEGDAKRVEAPSVLVVVRSAILSHRLPVALALVPVAISQDLRALRPKLDSGIDHWYLFAALRASEEWFLRRSHGTSIGSRALLQSELEQWRIPLPPHTIMHEIADAMRKYVEALDAVRAAQAELTCVGDAVLRTAFASGMGADESDA